MNHSCSLPVYTMQTIVSPTNSNDQLHLNDCIQRNKGINPSSYLLLTKALAFPVVVVCVTNVVKATELWDPGELEVAVANVVGKLLVGPEEVNAADVGT